VSFNNYFFVLSLSIRLVFVVNFSVGYSIVGFCINFDVAISASVLKECKQAKYSKSKQ
jgi:hypothetical protein